jgi:hypothetical protein
MKSHLYYIAGQPKDIFAASLEVAPRIKRQVHVKSRFDGSTNAQMIE